MRRLTHLFLKFRFTHSSFLDSRPMLQTSTQSHKSRIWYWRGNSTVVNQNNRETGLTVLSPLLARLLFDECFNPDACVNADCVREWTGSEKNRYFLALPLYSRLRTQTYFRSSLLSTPPPPAPRGVWHQILRILTLFQTKNWHFPHPFSYLASKIHTYFQTWSLRNFVIIT